MRMRHHRKLRAAQAYGAWLCHMDTEGLLQRATDAYFANISKEWGQAMCDLTGEMRRLLDSMPEPYGWKVGP